VHELAAAIAAEGQAKRPLIIAGGGVLYSQRLRGTLAISPRSTGIPVCETQAGKSSLPDDNALNMGGVGVTGTSAANALAAGGRCHPRHRHAAAGFHHRLLGLVQEPRWTRPFIGLNVQPFDAGKHRAVAAGGDATRR
jgi:3D-(3,5/4)-trihydroxycyclohexane-1,2-dione acylhydrolase (decyclizing)